jgi:phosphatidylserine decarboxylase
MLMYQYYFSTSSVSSIITDSYLALSKVKMSSLTMINVGTYKCANFFFTFATNDIDLSNI